ncbi:DNA primase large subunit-like [Styela clava]
MQFGGTPKPSASRRKRLRLADGLSDDLYPHGLMMYNRPPMCNITLQEFESFAYDRVKVLHYLDSLGVSYVKNSPDYCQKLGDYLRKNYVGFTLTSEPSKDTEERNLEWRRKDHISHFILRLAYCRSDELRRWFLEKEVDLFKYRFNCESTSSIKQFLMLNDMTYYPISEEEKEKFSAHLKLISYDMTQSKVQSTNFYKVPFTDVLNLVSSRRVFINSGYAYVPQSELISIISTRFREHLSKALAQTSRSLPELEEDDRLLPILRGFNKNTLAEAYDPNKNAGKVSIKQIDELSKISFPLCMRQLHQVLRETHHHKHWARLQYGLFLKGIGVTLEESIKFWKAEFSKGVGEEKFNKEYSYNFRHMFGREGKRTNYAPYGCMNIIMKNVPAPGEHHGCPFKHSSPELLKQRLHHYKIPKDSIDEIIKLMKSQHYQIACTKYYEVTHKVDEAGFQLNHPNQYFDESQMLLKGEKKTTGLKPSQGNAEFTPKWSQPVPESQTEESEMELDALMTEVDV